MLLQEFFLLSCGKGHSGNSAEKLLFVRFFSTQIVSSLTSRYLARASDLQLAVNDRFAFVDFLLVAFALGYNFRLVQKSRHYFMHFLFVNDTFVFANHNARSCKNSRVVKSICA